MRSSARARRLGRAALKQFGSLRKAAAALKLKSHAHLQQMLLGRMYDTPEMVAALKRADRRAERAWSMAKADPLPQHIDVPTLRGLLASIEHNARTIRALLKQVYGETDEPANSNSGE